MHQDQPVTSQPIARFCPECRRASPARSNTGLCEHCGTVLVTQGYCPICESRLLLGVGELCPKHDVKLLADLEELRPSLPPNASVAWVTVKRFPHTLAAAAPRIRLEAEGIPTFLEGERMGEPSMYRVATGGVKLQVPAELTADARVILDQDWSWPLDEPELEEPLDDHEAHAPPASGLPWALIWEVALVLAVTVPLIACLIAFLRRG